ncbi:MAG TPA: histidine kinase, partial [Chitinophagaceae bacterium]|nr:histidine kinase [Chitinophagaceae bacterium]
MLLRKNILLFIPLVLLGGLSKAQYKFNEPVMITKEQGLPTSDIRVIQKADDGFMWFGTVEGLCRFDGQQVKVYKPGEIQNPVGTSNTVYTILPIGDKIWVGTNQGVSVLDTKNETFHHYLFRNDDESSKEDSLKNLFYEPVPVLFLDRQGTIWAGTRNKGVWTYDLKEKNFKRITYPESAYPKIVPTLGTEFSVLSIEQSSDNDSIIWAGTTAGLEKINKYAGRVEWYTFPQEDKDYQVSLNAFRRLYSHNGLLYVGSWNAGMNVFDPKNKTFKPIEMLFHHYFGGSVSNFVKKSNTQLWITTSLGLYVYDFERKGLAGFWMNNVKENKVYAVSYVDDQERLWGVNPSGIQYFDLVTQQFTHYSLTHISDYAEPFSFYVETNASGDTITVCPRVTNSLFKFDKATRRWIKYPFEGLSDFTRGNLVVRGFKEVSPGEYLVATDQELYKFSLKTGRFTVAKGHPQIEFNRWGDIIKDHNGELWLCADADGLVRWNTSTGESRIYRKELNTKQSNAEVVRPGSLFEDSRGNIWFSRVDGFSVYLRAKDSIVNFINKENSLNSFQITFSFAEDKKGRVWANSENGWYGYIDVKNPVNGIVQKYNLREKDIGGYFVSMASDKQGNVWGYTNKLLVRINADDLSFSTFSFEYGVKDPEFFHFSFSPSGEILFGDRYGITMANINELKRNTETPVPYISQLNLLNRPVDASFYSSGLKLNYHQNFITIFFSAIAYTMPKGVRFRYRLQDFEDWTEVGSSQFANYTNIPPGNYVFQLQAANNEGVWNEQILELPIRIKTPFFLSWWFRIGLVLLIVALVYWFYKFRINQVRKKEKLKTQYEKKLANVEMTALLAQMNPHFLFNSLNSIDSYIIRNESNKASEYLNNFARLMRLILQNSRSNYTSLKDEVELLDLYLQMESLRFKDKFQYEINVSDDIDVNTEVIPPMLIQPYVENAIWHGLMHKKEGSVGKVKINISQKNNQLVCAVEDNGIGREKAEQIKASKPGNHKPSMGMQITKDRIDLINQLYNTNTSVEIVDMKDEAGNPTGTKV